MFNQTHIEHPPPKPKKTSTTKNMINLSSKTGNSSYLHIFPGFVPIVPLKKRPSPRVRHGRPKRLGHVLRKIRPDGPKDIAWAGGCTLVFANCSNVQDRAWYPLVMTNIARFFFRILLGDIMDNTLW